MAGGDPCEYSKQQLRGIASVAAEVERAGGGRLTHEMSVIEAWDETGLAGRIYAARIEAGVGDAGPEVHRGASFVTPAQALRQALQNYKNAHKSGVAPAAMRRGDAAAAHPIVAGNVGSLDDVPAGAAGTRVSGQ